MDSRKGSSGNNVFLKANQDKQNIVGSHRKMSSQMRSVSNNFDSSIKRKAVAEGAIIAEKGLEKLKVNYLMGMEDLEPELVALIAGNNIRL